LLVTIPPLQMSKSVAMQVSHAKRFSHVVDRIRIKLIADHADFADNFSRRFAGDERRSHSEAATAEADSATPRVQAAYFVVAALHPAKVAAARVRFQFLAHQATTKEQRLARHRKVPRAP